MSKESYVRGFCKAAEEHGVDPVQLAKFATTGAVTNTVPEKITYPPTNTQPTLLDHIRIKDEIPANMNTPGGKEYAKTLYDSLGTVNPALRSTLSKGRDAGSNDLSQIASLYRDLLSGRTRDLGIGVRPREPKDLDDQWIKALYASHTNAWPRISAKK